MKVVFLEPLRLFPKEPGTALYSLAYPLLAAVLRADGVEVRVLDPHAQCMDWPGLRAALEAERPDVVALGCNATQNAYRAVECLDLVKEIDPGIVTVVGGVYFSLSHDALKMTDSIDFIVVGDGEETLRELVRELGRANPDYSKIQGIVFRDHGRIVATPPRPPVQDLDSLPFPAYDLVPLDKLESHFLYGVPHEKRFPTKYAMLVTSRGCSWNCTFCTQWKSAGRRWRAFGAKRVVDELEYLNKVHGKTSFVFGDNNFNQDRQRVIDIADEIIRRDLNIKYSVTTRVDLLLRDRDILEKLVDSGLLQVTLGIDAVTTDEALHDVRKNLSVEQLRECGKMLREEHPEVLGQWFVVFGHRKDTRESMRATVRFLLDEVQADLVNFFFLMPHPGTDLWDVAAENDWIEVKDLSKYNESRPVMPTETLSRAELEKAVLECNREFYSDPKFLKKMNSRFGFKRQLIRMISEKIFRDITTRQVLSRRERT